MPRFKKQVVIGGVHGHELYALAAAIVDGARVAATVHETKATLRQALIWLEELAPRGPDIEELCEEEEPTDQ